MARTKSKARSERGPQLGGFVLATAPGFKEGVWVAPSGRSQIEIEIFRGRRAMRAYFERSNADSLIEALQAISRETRSIPQRRASKASSASAFR